MPRPRKKHSFLTRIKFLFTGEIQVIEPRPSRAEFSVKLRRARQAEAERQKIDKAEKQYNNLEPIK